MWEWWWGRRLYPVRVGQLELPVRVAMLVWERALEGDMQKKTGKQVLQRQHVVGPTCSSPSS